MLYLFQSRWILCDCEFCVPGFWLQGVVFRFGMLECWRAFCHGVRTFSFVWDEVRLWGQRRIFTNLKPAGQLVQNCNACILAPEQHWLSVLNLFKAVQVRHLAFLASFLSELFFKGIICDSRQQFNLQVFVLHVSAELQQVSFMNQDSTLTYRCECSSWTSN